MWKVNLFYSLVLTDVKFLSINFLISEENPLDVMEKVALVTRCHQKTLISLKKNNLWSIAQLVLGVVAHLPINGSYTSFHSVLFICIEALFSSVN